MEQDLKHYLAENPCRGFRASPHYFPQGDYLNFYATDEPCCAERVDDLLTVYLSTHTKKLVGFKIKGVRRLLAALGTHGMHVQSPDVALATFLVIGKAAAKDPGQRLRYEEAAPLVKDRAMNRGDLLGTPASC